MEKTYIVLGVGDSGMLFPLAKSKHQSRAIGYSISLSCNTSIKTCYEDEVRKYSESYHLLNLD
jgi:hypothetical protein